MGIENKYAELTKREEVNYKIAKAAECIGVLTILTICTNPIPIILAMTVSAGVYRIAKNRAEKTGVEINDQKYFDYFQRDR